MGELIRMVQDKAGIDETQARGAAEAVLGFLKERLPAPIASQIDAIIAGGGSGDPREASETSATSVTWET